jgi:hypothetical protein
VLWSVGGGAAAGCSMSFGAWVLVPLQGAVCAASLGAGDAAGCRVCFGAWMLRQAPLQGIAAGCLSSVRKTVLAICARPWCCGYICMFKLASCDVILMLSRMPHVLSMFLPSTWPRSSRYSLSLDAPPKICSILL